MTGTDPAIDAADRAAVALGWVIPPGRGIPESSPHDLAVASVRVAFASIRELHAPIIISATSCVEECEVHRDGECPQDVQVRVCRACWALIDGIYPYHAEQRIAEELLWPCETARLVYTSEELENPHE